MDGIQATITSPALFPIPGGTHPDGCRRNGFFRHLTCFSMVARSRVGLCQDVISAGIGEMPAAACGAGGGDRLGNIARLRPMQRSKFPVLKYGLRSFYHLEYGAPNYAQTI